MELSYKHYAVIGAALTGVALTVGGFLWSTKKEATADKPRNATEEEGCISKSIRDIIDVEYANLEKAYTAVRDNAEIGTMGKALEFQRMAKEQYNALLNAMSEREVDDATLEKVEREWKRKVATYRF